MSNGRITKRNRLVTLDWVWFAITVISPLTRLTPMRHITTYINKNCFFSTKGIFTVPSKSALHVSPFCDISTEILPCTPTLVRPQTCNRAGRSRRAYAIFSGLSSLVRTWCNRKKKHISLGCPVKFRERLAGQQRVFCTERRETNVTKTRYFGLDKLC